MPTSYGQAWSSLTPSRSCGRDGVVGTGLDVCMSYRVRTMRGVNVSVPDICSLTALLPVLHPHARCSLPVPHASPPFERKTSFSDHRSYHTMIYHSSHRDVRSFTFSFLFLSLSPSVHPCPPWILDMLLCSWQILFCAPRSANPPRLRTCIYYGYYHCPLLMRVHDDTSP
ncbi:hypothetical protein GY45DRAFT_772345 [Cubamyces sp. BRFM 1775]|nr:hypothetical protein GY45DRAFT_772345 [Cubamyces sp. BRFM 1775]